MSLEFFFGLQLANLVGLSQEKTKNTETLEALQNIKFTLNM
jgi:hypothetical protein